MTTVIFQGGGSNSERGQRGIVVVDCNGELTEHPIEAGRGGAGAQGGKGGDVAISIGAPYAGGRVIDVLRVCRRCEKQLRYDHPGIHTCSVRVT